MTSKTQQKAEIIRTERGLTISGTRITLYDLMDYLKEKYPIKFIRSLFDLTEAQMNAALLYIDNHPTEVEAEYELVIKQAEELQKYYEKRNRDLIAKIASKPSNPQKELIQAKLQEVKNKYHFHT